MFKCEDGGGEVLTVFSSCFTMLCIASHYVLPQHIGCHAGNCCSLPQNKWSSICCNILLWLTDLATAVAAAAALAAVKAS
jgi:hypothetical protein